MEEARLISGLNDVDRGWQFTVGGNCVLSELQTSAFWCVCGNLSRLSRVLGDVLYLPVSRTYHNDGRATIALVTVNIIRTTGSR